MKLNEKTILLTGATGHLGSEIALCLARAGAVVLLNARSPEPLCKLEDKINSSGGSAKIFAFDVTDQDQSADAFRKVDEEIGNLDGLINNAYQGAIGSLDKIRREDFQDSIRLNVTASFFLSKLAYPLMKRAGGGSIVNIASMYGIVSPDPEIYGDSGMDSPPQYGAGKAGLIQLTRFLACHWGKDGIRVNSISPGPFPTRQTQQLHPAFVENLRKRVPLKRLGEPHELCGAVRFLLSDSASYITGINIAVDGGWTAW